MDADDEEHGTGSGQEGIQGPTWARERSQASGDGEGEADADHTQSQIGQLSEDGRGQGAEDLVNRHGLNEGPQGGCRQNEGHRHRQGVPAPRATGPRHHDGAQGQSEQRLGEQPGRQEHPGSDGGGSGGVALKKGGGGENESQSEERPPLAPHGQEAPRNHREPQEGRQGRRGRIETGPDEGEEAQEAKGRQEKGDRRERGTRVQAAQRDEVRRERRKCGSVGPERGDGKERLVGRGQTVPPRRETGGCGVEGHLPARQVRPQGEGHQHDESGQHHHEGRQASKRRRFAGQWPAHRRTRRRSVVVGRWRHDLPWEEAEERQDPEESETGSDELGAGPEGQPPPAEDPEGHGERRDRRPRGAHDEKTGQESHGDEGQEGGELGRKKGQHGRAFYAARDRGSFRVTIAAVPGLRAVLYDWDGTLVDSAAKSFQCYVRVFAKYGIPYDEESYQKTYTPNWYRTYEDVGLPRDVWPEADALWTRLYEEEPSQLLPGARDALERLARADLVQGLVSSGEATRVRREIATHEVADFFGPAVVCGGETERRKPDPEPLLAGLQKLGVSPERAAYVGDSPEDVTMAKAAGVFSVGIPGGFPNRQALTDAAPDLLVGSLGVAVDALLQA